MALLNVYSARSACLLVQMKEPFAYPRPISSPTAIATRPSSSLSSPAQEQRKHVTISKEQMALCASKRRLGISIVCIILIDSLRSSERAMAEELELESFTDSNEGFTLLRPSSYIKVEKSGATALFEEANKGSNNVGVVVNPVRITNLREFGSPQLVADKIIQAEKRKESTVCAELISVGERAGLGGLQVYEFEYKVDSTRGGMKRIFTAVFVASKKLYLLNIAHSDKPESPLDVHTRMKLEQVLHSFDAASLA